MRADILDQITLAPIDVLKKIRLDYGREMRRRNPRDTMPREILEAIDAEIFRRNQLKK